MNKLDIVTKDIDAKITADTVLFFDMDGTLVDTDFANFLSYKRAIESVTKSKHDLTYNPDKRFNRSNLKIAVPNLNETEYENIIHEKEGYYNEFLTATKLNTAIANILSKYSKTNKTVLVTNCRKDRAIKILNFHGLMDKFSDSFFRQFSNTNGNINKFKYAIETLDISPKSVVVFENEKSEREDAISSGIPIDNILYL